MGRTRGAGVVGCQVESIVAVVAVVDGIAFPAVGPARGGGQGQDDG